MSDAGTEQEDLRFNALNHELVPMHTLVDEAEVTSVLEKYRISRDQLPKIRVDDPGARVIGAEAGNVVRITRESPTAGQHVVYRLVVQSL